MVMSSKQNFRSRGKEKKGREREKGKDKNLKEHNLGCKGRHKEI